MTNTAGPDSLKKRYAYKLASNFFGLVMGFAAAAIVPRALGPQAFGAFNFLTDFFYKFVSFFDMGFSGGLYVKLAKRPGEYGLLRYFFYYAGAVAALLVLFVLAAFASPLSGLIWPEQLKFYVCLGAGYGLLNWLLVTVGQLPDAYGLTVPAERMRVLQRAGFVACLGLLYLYGRLDLTSYFIYQFLFLGSLAGLFLWLIHRSGHRFTEGGRLGWDGVRNYSREFYDYCHPFFLAQASGLGAALLDRWLLQVFGGNTQQGFYGLSYSIGAFCFLFTSAMQPLLMREISIAHGEKDLEKMAALFRRHTPLLYTVAAYFSCFLALQSDKVVYIFGGSGYAAAALPILIMAFYPIHQTYGQLNATVFLASEQTRIYNRISVFFTVLGLPVTYFLIAPANFGGLGAGAAGLAVKMVAIQLASCNVQLYFISKYLKLSFWEYAAHQALSVGVLSALSFGAARLADYGLGLGGMPVAAFLTAGALYTVFAAAAAWLFPGVFGLRKQDLSGLVRSAAAKFRGG